MNLELTKKFKKILTVKKLILFISTAAIILLALFYIQPDTKEKETISYEQSTVKMGNIVIDMESDATIEFSKVNLSFGVSGRISEILLNVGEKVKAGDVIAKLDDKNYYDQYKLSQAKFKDARDQEYINLLSDELKLQKLKNEVEQIKDDYLEMSEIPEVYAANEIKIKKMELESKELEYQNAQKNHEILVYNYENNEEDQDEINVKIAKENLEDTILYSPVDGVLVGLDKKVGESVSDEEDVAVIHENNLVKAVTYVLEYDIEKIKVGQKAYVEVDALPDKEFVGEVSKIDILPTTDSAGIVTYKVEVDVKNPGSEIRDGMTGLASFVIKEVNNCLIIPYKAVKIVNKKQIVTVLDENGNMVEREVKTGFTDGSSVEVYEGLKVNDTVVFYK